MIYLLDRDAIAAASGARPPCAGRWDDAARDASLLPDAPAEPYCEGFGADPCMEPRAGAACVRGPLLAFGPPGDDASVDHAKMRTTPAYFRGEDGTSYVYVAGSTKAKRCTPEGTPPSVVRLRVAADSGKPAQLVRDGADTELRFVVDGLTLKLLWKSAPAEPGGKYVTPVLAHGVVYVATDRLHAFVPAP